MFSLKLIDKRFNRQLNHVKTDDYIKRLNIFNYIKSDDLFFKVKKDKEEIKKAIINMVLNDILIPEKLAS